MNPNILLTIIIISTLLCSYQENEIHYNEETYISDYFYNIDKNFDNTYTIFLYDKDKNIIQEQNTIKEPVVEKLNGKVIKVILNIGSPLNYTYFYDITNNEISQSYENIIAILSDKVVYMKDDNLVISNIFDESLYYKEIKRDWAKTAVPSSAIISVELLANNKVKLIYFKGIEFEEIKEIIDL